MYLCSRSLLVVTSVCAADLARLMVRRGVQVAPSRALASSHVFPHPPQCNIGWCNLRLEKATEALQAGYEATSSNPQSCRAWYVLFKACLLTKKADDGKCASLSREEAR